MLVHNPNLKLTRLVNKTATFIAASLMMLSVHAETSETYVNQATGRCLDSNHSRRVYTLDCNGGKHQRWIKRGKSLVNVATRFCLDSNSKGNVYTLACNGGNYQKWERRGNKRLVNVATGLCLDSDRKGKVYTLGCNGGNYQNWK